MLARRRNGACGQDWAPAPRPAPADPGHETSRQAEDERKGKSPSRPVFSRQVEQPARDGEHDGQEAQEQTHRRSQQGLRKPHAFGLELEQRELEPGAADLDGCVEETLQGRGQAGWPGAASRIDAQRRAARKPISNPAAAATPIAP